MPVPGDLPVFLSLALAVCRHQQAIHRVVTVVLPDKVTPAIKRLVAAARPGWQGNLRLQALPPPERWLAGGLGRTSVPVTLPGTVTGREVYYDFRSRLERAQAGPWTTADKRELAASRLEPFDDFYAVESGAA